MKLNYGLADREPLRGSRLERIFQALRKAGWYPGRRVDISNVLNYYQKQNVPLNAPSVSFYEEYYGIASQWYIMHTDLERSSPAFDFLLFPQLPEYRTNLKDFMYDDPDDSIESGRYSAAKACAGEPIVMVGEIGYYYPAQVWIADSGKLYCTHEYHEQVLAFDNVIELIQHELSKTPLDSVAMKP